MSGKCEEVVAYLRNTFDSGRTKSIKWRKAQLASFIYALEKNRQKIYDALAADMSKPKFEAALSEVENLILETRHSLEFVEEWVKPQPAGRNFISMMNDVYVEPEPYGVTLIIGAWNYPFLLSFGPLIGAIAAGNCAVIKPSELAPHAASCMEQIVRESLDNDAIRVITGDSVVASELLKCRFDHIFFTGSTRIGRIVMEAAAKYLTPVTLELGGKCPVFVDENIDYDISANRIIWGKFLNCGQTCLAPDYIMVTPAAQPKLIAALKRALFDYYGDNIEKNKDYPRIINDTHFKRLSGLIRASESKVIFGGKSNAATRYIEPTIMEGVTVDDDVMKEEIFGPILPIITVDNFDEAIRFINKGEKPLALYLFTKSKDLINLFKLSTSSGALTVNDCLMHNALMTLPFGGVGYSGMGSYHGKFGFDTYSHAKPCYIAPLAQEAFNVVRYAPYSDEKLSIIRWVGHTELSMTWLFKPLVWVYIFAVFLIRLATLPKHRPHFD